MKLRRFARFGAVVALFAASSCMAPTLPLPPPALPTVIATDAEGVVHLTSENGAYPHAIIVVYNRNPEVPLDKRVGGAEADDEGSWEADVFANPGDILDVTQGVGTTRSAPTSVTVR